MAFSTLFGHVALTFAAHPENVATEALNFVLGRSAYAREALVTACSLPSAPIPTSLRFQTQVAEADGAIPDLVGFDDAGVPRLVVEAKYWAGLTEHQPVDYLRRLPIGQVAALIFVGPWLRYETLWPELLRRCKLAGVHVDPVIGDEVEARWARIGQDHVLGLVSWRRVLSAVGTRVATAGDSQTAHEIEQLAGLCEQMDAEAFLPLRAEELAAPSPRRLSQFVQIVNDVAGVCVQRGIADKKGLRSSAGGGWYGHYLRLPGAGAFLHISFDHWAVRRETPFWLWVKDIIDGQWAVTPRIRERLNKLELEVPPRLLDDPYWHCPLIPLFPPFGVEREAVVNCLVSQVADIGKLIGSAPLGIHTQNQVDIPDEPPPPASPGVSIEP